MNEHIKTAHGLPEGESRLLRLTRLWATRVSTWLGLGITQERHVQSHGPLPIWLRGQGSDVLVLDGHGETGFTLFLWVHGDTSPAVPLPLSSESQLLSWKSEDGLGRFFMLVDT